MMKDRVAIITGGSRGIGRAVCIRLAMEGVHIVFSYLSNHDAADETKKMCREYGVKVVAIRADTTQAQDCEGLFEEALKINCRIDILVNNAGITKDNLIMRMKEEEFDAVINTNLKGAFLCMKCASKIMIKQRYGRIINISSIIGIRGNAGQVNYAASKAGVIGMTKSIAKELAIKGVTVNAVAPGMIETDMTTALAEQVREKVISEIPLKCEGKPEDIAEAVAFFAKEEARYITGQVLGVDGGMGI